MKALDGRRARQRLFSRARGRVLDLGLGTGLSLAAAMTLLGYFW